MASKIGSRGAGSPCSLSADRVRCVKCGSSLAFESLPQRVGSAKRTKLSQSNPIFPTTIRNTEFARYRCWAGKEDPGQQGDGTQSDTTFEKFVMTAGSNAGVSGTAAVVLGYLLGIDPFGNLHPDWHDVAIGFECLLPAFIFQNVFLYQLIRNKPGDGKLISIASDDGKLVIEPVTKGSNRSSESEVEQELGEFTSAARAYALKRVINTTWSIKDMTGSVPLLMLSLAISALAEEMLFRGVGLTALSLWVRDRLYEAGAQDLFFDTNYPTVEAAKWGALVIAIGGVLVRLGVGLQESKDRKEKLKGLLDDFADEVQHMEGMENVAKVIDPESFPEKVGKMIKVFMLQKFVETLDQLLYVVGTSTAFLLTGNLLASVAPMLASDVLNIIQSTERLIKTDQEREAAAPEVKDPKKLVELQSKMNDLKVRLLVTAVRRYLDLEEASSVSESKSGSTSGSPQLLSENRDSAGKNGEAEEKVDVSVNGEVLLMLVRREIGNLNSSIREENAKEDSDSERLRALESDRTILSDLLPQVELKVKENPEAQLGTFIGKNGQPKSKETIGAGRKNSNPDERGE